MPFSYWMHSPWHFITSSFLCCVLLPILTSSQPSYLFKPGVYAFLHPPKSFLPNQLKWNKHTRVSQTPSLCVHLASYKERFCAEPAHIRCPLLSLSSPSNDCQATMNLTNECCHSICVSCMVWTCYKSPQQKVMRLPLQEQQLPRALCSLRMYSLSPYWIKGTIHHCRPQNLSKSKRWLDSDLSVFAGNKNTTQGGCHTFLGLSCI